MTTKYKFWHLANLDYRAQGPVMFEREYETLAEAVTVAETLTAYDLYLDHRGPQPLIDSNAQGIMCWHGGEWVDRQEEDGKWICEEGCAE